MANRAAEEIGIEEVFESRRNPLRSGRPFWLWPRADAALRGPSLTNERPRRRATIDVSMLQTGWDGFVGRSSLDRSAWAALQGQRLGSLVEIFFGRKGIRLWV
jgi:hypothetical protein